MHKDTSLNLPDTERVEREEGEVGLVGVSVLGDVQEVMRVPPEAGKLQSPDLLQCCSYLTRPSSMKPVSWSAMVGTRAGS